ncbi:MAG: phenylacetate-CoA oxygenase subunit PaaJ [Flavobacteriales bacterium]|nr:phenylacetate-CoA oxygenase subunit PaaJ [Flavobacteriales bacterium]
MEGLTQSSKDEIWKILAEIPDPEIPVITIEELGVLRDLQINNNKIIVTITPTYTGCPAMKLFEDEIKNTLLQKGYSDVFVKLSYTPAWTTDWITDEAKEKLKNFGIAPPVKGTEDKGLLFSLNKKNIPCPRCNSLNTTLKNQFGSTACKALYFCDDCLEPFDYFKCF